MGWKDPLQECTGYPLQYSCLENPTDRGAWQAEVHRVTKSQTQLKQLSMYTGTQLVGLSKLQVRQVCSAGKRHDISGK